MITLAQVLFELDTSALKRIAEARELDPRHLRAQDKRQLAHSMAVELGNPRSITRALNHCTVRELRLLQLSLATMSEGVAPFEKVVKAGGSDSLAEAFRQILDQLTDQGLAFLYRRDIYVPDAVQRHIPVSLSDRYTLARSLEMYDAASLKRIRDNLGLSRDLTVKAAVINGILTALLGDAAVHIRSLPAADREVLDYVLQHGGAVPAVDLAQDLFDQQVIDDFFRYDWQNRWKTGRERNAVDRLLSRGLVFVVSNGFGYNLTIVIPSDLRAALSGGSRDLDFWTTEPPRLKPTTPPESIAPHPDIVRDVVALLAFVSSQEAPRTSTGYIHKSSLKAFARTLPANKEEHAAQVYGLCREAELIAPSGEKNVYTVTEAGSRWLEMSHEDQLATLYDAWLTMTVWAESYTEPLQRDNEFRSEEDVCDIRLAVLERIRTAEGDRWYTLDSIVESLMYYRPLLLTRNVMGYGMVTPADLVLRMVGQSLSTLGCADLGWVSALPAEGAGGAANAASPERHLVPVSFRLTPTGRHLLGMEGAEAPESHPQEDHFILQANAEIFVPPYLAAHVLYRVLTFTDAAPAGTAGNTVRITKESLRRALDQGQTVDEILTFLRERSRTPVPQNVEYLIRETGGRHGSLRLGTAHLYLRAENETLLQEMLARKELKAHGIRPISENVAILTSGDLDRVLRDLRKAGYLPIADNRSGATVRPAGSGTRSAPRAPEAKKTKSDKIVFNWEKIAREDGVSWEDKDGGRPLQLSMTKPTDAVQARPLIRIVMTQAIKSKTIVEVAYRVSGQKGASLVRMTPQIILGDLVTGFVHGPDHQDTLDLSRAEWARLARE